MQMVDKGEGKKEKGRKYAAEQGDLEKRKRALSRGENWDEQTKVLGGKGYGSRNMIGR